MRKNSRCDGLWIWYQISPLWRSMICFNVSGHASPPSSIGSVCHAIVVSVPSGAPVQITSRCASWPAASRPKRISRMPNSSRNRLDEIGDGLHQRVAVDVEPDRLVDGLELRRQRRAWSRSCAAPPRSGRRRACLRAATRCATNRRTRRRSASSCALRRCASSPMMPMNRSRASWSMSGNDAIVSIAARMLASDARVPCVSVCSSRSRRLPVSIRRVMLSSISTNPEMPSAAAPSAPRRSARRARAPSARARAARRARS